MRLTIGVRLGMRNTTSTNFLTLDIWISHFNQIKTTFLFTFILFYFLCGCDRPVRECRGFPTANNPLSSINDDLQNLLSETHLLVGPDPLYMGHVSQMWAFNQCMGLKSSDPRLPLKIWCDPLENA